MTRRDCSQGKLTILGHRLQVRAVSRRTAFPAKREGTGNNAAGEGVTKALN
ncbi:hypothetical protein ACFLYL_04615 [Chloroflexota bacterium]